MSITACIAIGIQLYEDESLAPLHGAKVDADRVYNAFLNSEIFDCDDEFSSLHHNITRHEAREIIANAAYNTEIDTLSIYFAGHGGSNSAGYFLCCKDCDPKKLAYSALSLTDIFSILSSSPMKHVNLIIDACNAGGLAQDLSAISNNPQIGAAAGISISIIALSSRDESSFENAEGGFGTTAFLNIIEGVDDNYSNKKYLSLADVAQAVDIRHPAQSSSFWTINLSGAPRFCKNVFAEAHRKAELFSLPTISGKTSKTISTETIETIWKTYLDIVSSFDARAFQTILEGILEETHNDEDAASLLVGLFESFRERSRHNKDSFTPVICCSVFLFLVNGLKDRDIEKEYILNVLLDELKNTLGTLNSAMQNDEFFLVRDGDSYSSFFTLPQRICQIAAWAILATYLDQSLNDECEQSRECCHGILENLKKHYSDSFDLMSESQAPAILIISTLSQYCDKEEWADEYLATLYFSLFYNNQKIAKVDINTDVVFEFLRHRLLDEKPNYEKFCARPSEVILALISHYWSLNNLETIRYDFEDLDQVNVNAYIPNDYAHFSEERIHEGTNLGFRIGFDIFTAQDLKEFIERYLLENIANATEESDEKELRIAIISSLIYPDRLPWFLLLNIK